MYFKGKGQTHLKGINFTMAFICHRLQMSHTFVTETTQCSTTDKAMHGIVTTFRYVCVNDLRHW